jgi:integrase
MSKGVDPRATKKADQSAKVTLAEVAAAYIARPGKLKESSADTINRHVTTTFKAWSAKPISSITEGMCRVRYREMLTEGLDGKRKGQGGSPGQANQAFSVLGALLAYAGRQYRRADGSPLCDRSPVAALKDDWVTLKPRTRRIPDNKVGAVWHALAQWRAETFNRETLASIDLVAFLLLTGCRLNEAASLRWAQVHLEDDVTGCWWHLPDPKNRHPFWFPLSSQAVAILKRRREKTNSEFVFESWSKAGHIIDPRGIMAKVSEIAGERLSNHDMRRTMTTVGISACGLDFYKVELLTGHLPSGVTARHYLETSRLGYLYPEAQKIADYLDQQATIAKAKLEVANDHAQAA